MLAPMPYNGVNDPGVEAESELFGKKGWLYLEFLSDALSSLAPKESTLTRIGQYACWLWWLNFIVKLRFADGVCAFCSKGSTR